MGQDEVWWSSPAEVQRMALRVVSGAERTGVRGWSVVETHEQWVGLRFAQNKCQWKTGFCSPVGLLLQSRVLCGGGRPPICCPATHSSRDPATGDLIFTSERKRESIRERERE